MYRIGTGWNRIGTGHFGTGQGPDLYGYGPSWFGFGGPCGTVCPCQLDRKWLGFCSSLLVESARDLARVMNVNSRATAITMWINY